MRILIFIVLQFISGNIIFAQQRVDINDLPRHIGDSILVCGKIYSGRFLKTSSNQPTFLNMGADYPNQPLTLVIWVSTREKLSYEPEKELLNKNICVTGRVEIFKGKPQLVIKDQKQIIEQ